MVVGIRLNDWEVCLVAGGTEHFQRLASADHEAGVNIIIIVDIAGYAGRYKGKGSTVLDGCEDGGISLAQTKQPHGAVVGLLQNGVIRREQVDAVYILGIVSYARAGLSIVEVDNGAVAIRNNDVAACGVILRAEVPEQLDSVNGCAALLFDPADRDGYIQMIALQPVFQLDGEGNRDNHRASCQIHLLNAVLFGKANGLKHGGKLAFGIFVVSCRLQQFPHAAYAGIRCIIPGKRLGIRFRKRGKNFVKLLHRNIRRHQTQGMGKVAHLIGDADTAVELFILHLIPLHGHREGIVDTLLAGGIEVVDYDVGFQIIPVGSVGHRIVIRLWRDRKGDLPTAFIQNGHIRGLLVEVQLQRVAVRDKLIVLVAGQLLLFQLQLASLFVLVSMQIRSIFPIVGEVDQVIGQIGQRRYNCRGHKNVKELFSDGKRFVRFLHLVASYALNMISIYSERKKLITCPIRSARSRHRKMMTRIAMKVRSRVCRVLPSV